MIRKLGDYVFAKKKGFKELAENFGWRFLLIANRLTCSDYSFNVLIKFTQFYGRLILEITR